MRSLRLDICRQKKWLLHDNNAPSLTSFFTTEFFPKNGMIFIPQLPYAPDLAPCNFSFSLIEDRTGRLAFGLN
jgi:hypothetical protein